jgi:hypothetical protein
MWNLDALLIDGPFRGRWITLDESVARRGVIWIPEKPKPSVAIYDPQVEYSVTIHRYRLRWTSKVKTQTGLWIGEYSGRE